MARQSRIGRLCVRAGVPFILAIVMLNLRIVRSLDIVIIVFASLILAPLLPILAYRWITRRVLWKVRNRLYLTYLLMGLAPVVLFATLGGIAAYLFSGQFATNTALSILDQASLKVKDETASEAAFNLTERAHPPPSPGQAAPQPFSITRPHSPARVSHSKSSTAQPGVHSLPPPSPNRTPFLSPASHRPPGCMLPFAASSLLRGISISVP